MMIEIDFYVCIKRVQKYEDKLYKHMLLDNIEKILISISMLCITFT